MGDRREVIAANWKMNKTASEAAAFIQEYADAFSSQSKDVILFTPAIAFERVSPLLRGTSIMLGAQNMHPAPSGAFTGEISAGMIKEFGVTSVLIGHSERRTHFREDNTFLLEKLRTALAEGFVPVFCVGENLTQREESRTMDVISEQLSVLQQAGEPGPLIIAYEPVWAIGTGKVATGEEAQEVCGSIRDILRSFYGGESETIRILYGGSVNQKNISNIMTKRDIDGVLVGGASLTDEFARLVHWDGTEADKTAL